MDEKPTLSDADAEELGRMLAQLVYSAYRRMHAPQVPDPAVTDAGAGAEEAGEADDAPPWDDDLGFLCRNCGLPVDHPFDEPGVTSDLCFACHWAAVCEPEEAAGSTFTEAELRARPRYRPGRR